MTISRQPTVKAIGFRVTSDATASPETTSARAGQDGSWPHRAWPNAWDLLYPAPYVPSPLPERLEEWLASLADDESDEDD